MSTKPPSSTPDLNASDATRFAANVVRTHDLMQESRDLLFAAALAANQETGQRERFNGNLDGLQRELDRYAEAIRALTNRLHPKLSNDQASVSSSPAQQKLHASMRAFLNTQLQLAATLMLLPPEQAVTRDVRECLLSAESMAKNALESYFALAAASKPTTPPPAPIPRREP